MFVSVNKDNLLCPTGSGESDKSGMKESRPRSRSDVDKRDAKQGSDELPTLKPKLKWNSGEKDTGIRLG